MIVSEKVGKKETTIHLPEESKSGLVNVSQNLLLGPKLLSLVKTFLSKSNQSLGLKRRKNFKSKLCLGTKQIVVWRGKVKRKPRFLRDSSLESGKRSEFCRVGQDGDKLINTGSGGKSGGCKDSGESGPATFLF